MSDDVLVASEIPLTGDPRLKNWAKVVDSVDESRAGGYAFGGYFVAAGGIQDVPVGAVLVVYGEKGSRANPRPEARVYTVNGDGTLSHHASASGRAWARTIRDRVADLVETARRGPDAELEWDPTLGRYSTAALHEELRRRGWGDGP